MTTDPSSRLPRTNAGFVRRLVLGSLLSGLTRGISRIVVALVFAIGVLPSSGATVRAANESEIGIHGAEDFEAHRRNNLDAQAPRRLRAGAPLARELELPTLPRTLAPQRIEVPRPSWQRPRRTPPPDNEDDALA
jgi:hypothetical protein